MNINPYSEDEFSTATEHSRKAVDVLIAHKISPSPLNYRMSYDAESGSYQELRDALKEISGHPDGFSPRTLWNLYQRFYIHDDEALSLMRSELQQMIANIQNELSASDGNFSDYTESLSRFSNILKSPVLPANMPKEVRMMMDGTQLIKESHHRLHSQVSSMMTEIHQLREELEQVKEESLTDSLTGINNRKAFDVNLNRHMQLTVCPETTFCLLLADIDHFKKFNDTYGHLVGDKVIRYVASIINRCLDEGDMVARFGGEEFAVILTNPSMSHAVKIAEKIRQSISSGKLKNKSTGKCYGNVTVSIGAAQYCSCDKSAPDLILRVDEALYSAKANGRNRVEQSA